MTSPSRLKVETTRLTLVAGTLEHVRAELGSAANLAVLLDVEVPSGWPPGEYDRDAQQFFQDRLKEGGAAVVGWNVWYAILRATGKSPATLVASGGFLAPPDEAGVTETGFSVVADYRGHGYATEMVKALTLWAFTDHRVNTIIAHTSTHNIASRNVLDRTGFHLIGHEVENLRYELRRPGVPP